MVITQGDGIVKSYKASASQLLTGEDLSGYVANIRVTVFRAGRIIAAASAADLTLKIDGRISNLLNESLVAGQPKVGVIRRGSTKEYVSITAINGSTITVVRAQNDSAGNPTTAIDVRPNDRFSVLAMDSLVTSSILDPSDTTNMTVNFAVDSAATRMPAGDYGIQYTFANGTGAGAHKFSDEEPGGLIVEDDPNAIGVDL